MKARPDNPEPVNARHLPRYPVELFPEKNERLLLSPLIRLREVLIAEIIIILKGFSVPEIGRIVSLMLPVRTVFSEDGYKMAFSPGPVRPDSDRILYPRSRTVPPLPDSRRQSLIDRRLFYGKFRMSCNKCLHGHLILLRRKGAGRIDKPAACFQHPRRIGENLLLAQRAMLYILCAPLPHSLLILTEHPFP